MNNKKNNTNKGILGLITESNNLPIVIQKNGIIRIRKITAKK